MLEAEQWNKYQRCFWKWEKYAKLMRFDPEVLCQGNSRKPSATLCWDSNTVSYLKIMEGSRGLEFSRSCDLILLTDFSCSRHCILRPNIHKCPELVWVLSGVGNNAILKSWLVSKRKDSQRCFEQSSVMLWGQSLKARPFGVLKCLCSFLKDMRLFLSCAFFLSS